MKRKILSVFLLMLLCLGLSVGVFAYEEDALTEDRYLFDTADLLSDGEEADLNEDLLDVSEEYEAQVVVITVPFAEEEDIDDYTEYLYDSMEFGYGDDYDGILLLVCMDPREYRILSNGFAADAIGSDEIDAMGEAIRPDLSDGDYAEAFETFVEQCDYYLDGHLNGFPFDFSGKLTVALVIGIVIGLVVALILKAQLKSVHKQHQANVYVKPGSMQLTVQNDLFLYRDVTRTKRESSSSSSRSGGSSRNVGGGSF